LGTPVYVRPIGRRAWSYVGIGRYDRLLSGALTPGEVVSVHKPHRTPADVLQAFLESLDIDIDAAPPAPVIAGGSDADPALTGCKTPSVNSGPPM